MAFFTAKGNKSKRFISILNEKARILKDWTETTFLGYNKNKTLTIQSNYKIINSRISHSSQSPEIIQ